MNRDENLLAPPAKSTVIVPLLFGMVPAFLIFILAAILCYLLINGYRGLSPSWFLTRAGGEGYGIYDLQKTGVFDMMVGTLLLVFGMSIVVMPLGVMTGIYLHEFADTGNWSSTIIRSAINNLAGVPSVIFGLFGRGFFVLAIGGTIDYYILHTTDPVMGKPAIIWSALTLAILTLPVVVVSTEQALRGVPFTIREAALGLGANRLQTLIRVVLPQAWPGILTGGLLAVSRGAGEVAPIIFTGVATFTNSLPTHLNDQFMELSYHVYILCTQSPDSGKVLPLIFNTVVTLLSITFTLNFLTILARAWLRRRFKQT
jgi:phosphate transport system permease protein